MSKFTDKDYIIKFNRIFDELSPDEYELINIDLEQRPVKIIYKHLICDTIIERTYKQFKNSVCKCNNKKCVYERVQETKEETLMREHGVKNVFQLQEVKDKIYTEEWKEKCKQTRKERYGDENYVNVEKIKQIKFERYGDENYVNPEKAKETCLEKYGKDNVRKVDKFKDKIYTEEWKEKRIITNMKRYNKKHYVETEEFLRKRYKTKKKNKSFNKSKPEKEFKDWLTDNDIRFESQYKSDEYSFDCDFYLSDLDLYIELNLLWTHNFEPFDIFNKDHIDKIKDVTKRSNELNFKNERKKYYDNMIYTWTDLDVRKRKYVENNNLFYIEVFNKKQLETLKYDILLNVVFN